MKWDEVSFRLVRILNSGGLIVDNPAKGYDFGTSGSPPYNTTSIGRAIRLGFRKAGIKRVR